MTVLRVCYKYGVRFDEAYYLSKHLPLAGAVMGPYGMKRVEVVKVGTPPDGSKPPYQFIFSGYFESPAALQNAMQGPRMGEVLGDIPNYYDGTPDVLTGEVLALPGQA
ncbi:MAG TPA: EthD family reductase [Candidatus Acidoferrales bacterium]|nr:EthD family reductase [Candidatus Acidoferrales bacterium]